MRRTRRSTPRASTGQPPQRGARRSGLDHAASPFTAAFDVVVEYFADDPDATRTVAMERIIHSNAALSAGQLERVARTQHQLLDTVRERTARHDRTDPRAAAIVGAALSCLIAAKSN